MSTTIALATNTDVLYDVYNEDFLNEIPVLNKSDVLNQKVDTDLTEYIISTWDFPQFSKEQILRFFPNLKYVFYGAGDTSYFEELFAGSYVQIINAKEVNGKSVADFVLGQILLANKGYFLLQQIYKKNKAKITIKSIQKITNNYTGNYSAKIGLLGFGTIAQQLATMLNQFGFEIYAYDPYVPKDIFDRNNVIYSDFHTIFQECSVVSNHLPDVEETNRIIDKNCFSLMDEYATFINTGRGKQINEYDLFRHCLSNKNFICLLDVTRREPILPFHPLYFLSNVLITPHIAGSQSNEKKRIGEFIISKYNKVLGEESTRNVKKNKPKTFN